MPLADAIFEFSDGAVAEDSSVTKLIEIFLVLSSFYFSCFIILIFYTNYQQD